MADTKAVSDSGSLTVRALAPFISMTEFCDMFGVSRMTGYGIIADGHVKSFKLGARRMIDSKSVIEYVERLKREGTPRDPRIDKMLAGRAAKRAERRAQRPKLLRR